MQATRLFLQATLLSVGDADAEGSALSNGALHANAAVVILHDFFTSAEPQAGPTFATGIGA